MLRIVLGLAAVATTALALATTGSARPQTTPPTLVGTVGPGFTITLKRNGVLVKTLTHGTYKFVIHDLASIHSFSLKGPAGFTMRAFTTVPFTGTKTVTLALKAGAYK